MLIDHLDRDFGARVSDSDDEHRPFFELRRVAVLAGMELVNAGVQLVGERRHPGGLVGCHRHDDVLSLEDPVACFDDEMAAVPRQPIDSDAGPNRELEPCGVGLEVVGHVVLRRERLRRAGEIHPRQGVEAGGCEEAKRVPALSPRVADPLVGVEDHEGEVPPGQVVADGETCLSPADDYGREALSSE